MTTDALTTKETDLKSLVDMWIGADEPDSEFARWLSELAPAHSDQQSVMVKLHRAQSHLGKFLVAVEPATVSAMGDPYLSPRELLRRSRTRLSRVRRFHVKGTDSTLPSVLAYLDREIQSSRRMLAFDYDWDGDESPGYDKATWNRAVKFLVKTADWAWETLGELLPSPSISPGPNGSIDLEWVLPDRELLINVPHSASEPSTFYGDDGNEEWSIEGQLDLSDSCGWIAAWLKRI